MSVLLDTNVVSELLRPSSDPVIDIWVGDRRATALNPLPPLREQRRFADLVAQADRTVTVLANSGSKTASKLTASLMDRVLEH